MRKIIRYIFSATIMCVLYAHPCRSQEFLSTKDTVAISGTLSARNLKSANGRWERVFLLSLSTPMNVEQDDFGGRVANVRRIQLVFNDNVLYPGAFGDKTTIPRKYFGKKVTVVGLLFHQLTAHHYERIVMKVHHLSIKENSGRTREK